MLICRAIEISTAALSAASSSSTEMPSAEGASGVRRLSREGREAMEDLGAVAVVAVVVVVVDDVVVEAEMETECLLWLVVGFLVFAPEESVAEVVDDGGVMISH
jgi:hypothetical protein